MKWLGKWKELNIQEVHGEVSINILRERKESKFMKLWNNLSKGQKRMAKISAIQTIVMATALVIVKPIVKGEVVSVTDMLIEFMIFVLVLLAFNCIFIIGAKPPKQK